MKKCIYKMFLFLTFLKKQKTIEIFTIGKFVLLFWYNVMIVKKNICNISLNITFGLDKATSYIV